MSKVSEKTTLKIYTLGQFSIFRHGVTLRHTRKAPHKPLLLLKVLIASGGRQVGCDYLASLMWPDTEGDLAQTSFGTTLHRLRKYLGGDRYLIVEDGCVTLNSESVWVDVWAFEKSVGGIRTKLAELGSSSLVDSHAQALLMAYQGHFLEHEGVTHWSVSMRERLRSKYIHCLIELGRYWERLGSWDKAILCYRKGIEVDDLVETFYQRLMVSLVETGKKPEALAVYRQCRQILSVALGLEPMDGTQALYQSIHSGCYKTA
jgi:LuxR family maltose regulon positive regulatory protein